MLSKAIDMHAATAGEICDHAVQRHGVAVVMVFKIDVEISELVLVTEG